MKKIDNKVIKSIVKDRDVRRTATQKSFWLFFIVYFSIYIKYELAKYHEEIINIIQANKEKIVCITAFRGSGKSTIITTASSLWSILGVHQKKFILIISQTKAQAKVHMTNLRSELENNDLLKSDLGPFQEETDGEWNSSSLVFSNTKSRITIASLEQSIRGIRHRNVRPDLIILDDIEDMQSVKTSDSRDKTFDWFTREIIPLGDLNTRIIVVGNLIHDDSLTMRLKKKILNEDIAGIYKEYPLVDNNGICIWPGKFPTKESLEEFEKTIISPISWQREYLLKVVPDEYQVIHKDWIKTYKELPSNMGSYSCIIMGVDPAISEKSKADYSAIVSGLVVMDDNNKTKLYILPNIVNVRLNTPDLIERIKAVYRENQKIYNNVEIIIESNAFQESIVQFLQREGYARCRGIKTSEDKRTRLSMTSFRLKFGDILFPENEVENLITQMVGFGSESHDDIVDAYILCVNAFIDIRVPRIQYL